MKPLEEYPIEREEFVTAFCSVLDSENDSVITNTDIYDIITEGYEGDTYKCWLYDDEVYILNKDTGDLVNWYKIGHIGRCLTSTLGSNSSDYVKFFVGLADEMREQGVISNERKEEI